MLGRPRAQKDAFSQVSHLLQREVRRAGVLVHLLEKKIEKWFGELERVGDIATGVLVDRFLTPGIELFRVKKTPSDNYAGLVRLSKIDNHADLTLCDYAAIPSERAAALRITRCNI